MFKRFAIGGAVAAFAALALLGIEMVAAHSRPVRFDTPPGAVLNAAPATITGWFTQPIRRDPNWSFLQVSDQNGARVDTGEAALSPDRRSMTVTLRGGLPPGRYLVTWRTWDDNDGRIFGDCYSFFVGQAAADAAVTGNTRLDGGGTCQRIDISGTAGTPVAGGTPQATTAPSTGGDGHEDEGGEAGFETSEDESGDAPWWSLVLIGAIALVAGGIGGRLLGALAGPRG